MLIFQLETKLLIFKLYCIYVTLLPSDDNFNNFLIVDISNEYEKIKHLTTHFAQQKFSNMQN